MGRQEAAPASQGAVSAGTGAASTGTASGRPASGVPAGFERPDAGTVELAGVDVTREPPYARNVNTVFQDYALFPHMNVLENVEYGLRVAQVPKAERRRRAEAALEMVRLAGLG